MPQHATKFVGRYTYTKKSVTKYDVFKKCVYVICLLLQLNVDSSIGLGEHVFEARVPILF